MAALQPKQKDPLDALSTFLGLDQKGFVDTGAYVDPSGGTVQEKETPTTSYDFGGGRTGSFSGLTRDMAATPYEQDITAEAAAADAKDKARMDHMQVLSDFFTPAEKNVRDEQENFQLRKAGLEHPNPNVSPFLGGNAPPSLASTVGAGGPAVNPAIGGKGVGQSSADQDARFQELTRDLNPDAIAKIQGLLNYSIPMPTGNVLARPEWATVIGRALQIDPSFDFKKYGERQAYLKDYASGSTSRAITGLDTVMHHLDTFDTNAKNLHNSSVMPYNVVANYFKGWMPGGFPEKKSFEDSANAVAGELSNVFKATGATDQEISGWHNQLSSSETQEEFDANVATLVNLIKGRMDAVSNRYNTVMGRQAPDFLSPESRQIFNRFSKPAQPTQGSGGGISIRRID